MLTGASLVLTRRSLPKGWLAFIALSAAMLCAGIGGWQLLHGQQRHIEQQASTALQQTRRLQADLHKAQLLQQVAAARSEELEKQIDALHRELRDSAEELAYLRTSRNAKRQP
jgi:uncharacterized protein HemX